MAKKKAPFPVLIHLHIFGTNAELTIDAKMISSVMNYRGGLEIGYYNRARHFERIEVEENFLKLCQVVTKTIKRLEGSAE